MKIEIPEKRATTFQENHLLQRCGVSMSDVMDSVALDKAGYSLPALSKVVGRAVVMKEI